MRFPRFTTLQLLLAATLIALVLGLFTSAWRTGSPDEVAQVCYSPNGQHLAARYSSGIVRVWRLNAHRPKLVAKAFGTPPLPREGHREMLECMCFLDDRRLIKLDSGMSSYSMSPVQVRELDVTTGKLRNVMRIKLDYVQTQFVAASGNYLYLTEWSHGGKSVLRFDLAKGILDKEFPARPQPIVTLALSNDGHRLATIDQAGELAVLDADTGETLHELPGPPAPNVVGTFFPLLDINADGTLVVVKSGGSVRSTMAATLFDTRNGFKPRKLPIPSTNGIAQVSISRDASVLAVNHDEGVECYDTATERRICQIATHHSNGNLFAPLDYIALAPDGKTLATYADDRIWVWDAVGGQVLQRLGGASRLIPMLIFVAGFAAWAAAWGIVCRRSRESLSVLSQRFFTAEARQRLPASSMRAPLAMRLCWGSMLVGGVVAVAIPIVMMFIVGPWLFPTVYFSLVVGIAAIARGASRDTLRLQRTVALQLANMVALDPANVVFAAMEYALIRTSSAQIYLRSASA